MRETSFIRQNKEKWKEFEKSLEHKSQDPDHLSHLFIQITDDLSYSRTFYPNRSVRVYLNNLAQHIFYKIYKSKKTRWGRVLYFWSDELPQLMYEARTEFRMAFLIFGFAFIIGAFSSHMDPEFPRAILGDDYVDMTLENIESGDPMRVYKQRGEFGMSLGITANNLFVAFLTFVMGVFFAIGSAAIMVSNGIMVGAFQYFFYQQGLLQESFLTIWIHGTLEISAIIIAGAAGLTLGKGLVFPGTLSRLQAFQISARRGLKIMIGIVPIFILAGFIEGYLTRHTGTPDAVRAFFIIICLAFILGYFVWYPRFKARIGFGKPINDTRLPPNLNQSMDLSRIKASGELFADTFVVFKKHFAQICLTALAAAAVYCGIVFPISTELPNVAYRYSSGAFGAFENFGQFFYNINAPMAPLVNIFIYSVVAFICLNAIARLRPDYAPPEKHERTGYYLGQFFKITVAVFGVQLMMMTGTVFPLLLLLFAGPVVFLYAAVLFLEKRNMIDGLGRTFSLLHNNYGRALGLMFLSMSICLLFFMLMDTVLIYFYFDLISWNLSFEQEILDQIGAVLLTFISVFMLGVMMAVLTLAFGLLYYTLLEIRDAPSLKKRIPLIGMGSRIQGLEKEEQSI